MIVLIVKTPLSYVNMKPLIVRLVPVALCLLHVAPCAEKASVLSVATLEVLERSDEVAVTHLLQSVLQLVLVSLVA